MINLVTYVLFLMNSERTELREKQAGHSETPRFPKDFSILRAASTYLIPAHSQETSVLCHVGSRLVLEWLT